MPKFLITMLNWFLKPGSHIPLISTILVAIESSTDYTNHKIMLGLIGNGTKRDDRYIGNYYINKINSNIIYIYSKLNSGSYEALHTDSISRISNLTDGQIIENLMEHKPLGRENPTSYSYYPRRFAPLIPKDDIDNLYEKICFTDPVHNTGPSLASEYKVALERILIELKNRQEVLLVFQLDRIRDISRERTEAAILASSDHTPPTAFNGILAPDWPDDSPVLARGSQSHAEGPEVIATSPGPWMGPDPDDYINKTKDLIIPLATEEIQLNTDRFDKID